MNKLVVYGLVVAVAVLAAFAFVFANSLSALSSQQPTKEMDFTVSGSSDCLRFLNNSVQTVYALYSGGK